MDEIHLGMAFLYATAFCFWCFMLSMLAAFIRFSKELKKARGELKEHPEFDAYVADLQSMSEKLRQHNMQEDRSRGRLN